ncbi:MAG: T9SS type A sorting domain-containing protein, partial [Ignavibacteriaceae bacterium]|nr:T9SS type A sorting domain-containing protein [Ignavibacteriaceae bacterium]
LTMVMMLVILIDLRGQTILEFNIKGVDGGLLNGSKVTVYDGITNIQIGETELTNSQGTLQLTGIKETGEEGAKEGIKIYAKRLKVMIEQKEEGEMKINLTDILGRRIKEKEKKGREGEINLEGLSNGIYILEVKGGEETEVRKIIKGEKELYLSIKEGKRGIKNRLSKGKTESYRIKIKGIDHYTRTIETTITNIEDFVVPYVEQEGINDTTFYELCKEANFKLGGDMKD